MCSAAEEGAAAEAKEAATGVVVPLTRKQLMHTAFYAAVPMVGFGIMDQTVMIQAGDAIDNSIGVTLGLSTLTAAACGQVFSDLAGVTFGGTVEAFFTRLGLTAPMITAAQRASSQAKFANTFGMAVGVVCGCLIGMTSLLFMDLDKAERQKREAELDSIFATMLDVRDTFDCERCSLWMVDREKHELWSKVFDTTVHKASERGQKGQGGIVVLEAGRGISGYAADHDEFVSVPDVYKDPRFNQAIDLRTKTKTRNMMCGPVHNSAGEVVAVVSILNKNNGGQFDRNDERLLRMLAEHVGHFIDHVGN